MELLKHLSEGSQLFQLGTEFGRALRDSNDSRSSLRTVAKCTEANSTPTSPSSHRPRSSRVAGKETRKGCPVGCRPRGFHGTFRTSVPDRSSVRARREGARLRGSPTRVFPLGFSPPQPSETATTTREMGAPRECSLRPRCACSASGHTALLPQRQEGPAARSPRPHPGQTRTSATRSHRATSLARLPSAGYRRPRPRQATGC